MARRFYAVQIGGSSASDYGSTRKREAFRMARAEAKANPGEEVRICLCTTESDFCDGEIIVQEAAEPLMKNSEPDITSDYYAAAPY